MLQGAVRVQSPGLGPGPGHEPGCHENTQKPGRGSRRCYGNRRIEVDKRTGSPACTMRDGQKPTVSMDERLCLLLVRVEGGELRLYCCSELRLHRGKLRLELGVLRLKVGVRIRVIEWERVCCGWRGTVSAVRKIKAGNSASRK